MECGDQVLRNFLNGLVIHLRGTRENPKNPGEVLLGKDSDSNKPEKTSSFSSRSRGNKKSDLTPVKYKNKGDVKKSSNKKN